MKYLVVDDDKDIRFLAEEAGHLARASVPEALGTLRKEPNIDLVLIDVQGVGELHQLINVCLEKRIDVALITGGDGALASFGKSLAANKEIDIYEKIHAIKLLEEAS